MALAQRQELRQSQSLVMTPQLQQAIKLLQLANLELTEYVEAQAESNPLLEITEVQPDGGATDEDPPRDAEAEAEPTEAPLDVDYDQIYADEGKSEYVADPRAVFSGGPSGGGGGRFESGAPGVDQTLSREETLREHLSAQLGLDVVDPVDRLIGIHLIDTIDDAGYLTGELESIAATVGCEVARVEATLAVLQALDPPGVLARNLSECLAIQLRERNRLDPAIQALLDNLELVADGDLERLSELCGVEVDEVADMVDEIRRLNPKPGQDFQTEVIQEVVPDVFVRRRTDGGWSVDLNTEALPKVLVDMAYHTDIAGRAKSREDKTYISEQLHAANWLVKSLDQRARTILRVATELVRQQEAFLVLGVEHLRPLNLRDIAAAIDMHESTVSRVTANKFIATQRGVYPMKYFFTAAIASSCGGQAHAAEAVRHRIRQLVEAETPEWVLSDDSIVKALSGADIDIARRTVAKYRDAMRIPSSVERRRRLRAQARNGARLNGAAHKGNGKLGIGH